MAAALRQKPWRRAQGPRRSTSTSWHWLILATSCILAISVCSDAFVVSVGSSAWQRMSTLHRGRQGGGGLQRLATSKSDTVVDATIVAEVPADGVLTAEDGSMLKPSDARSVLPNGLPRPGTSTYKARMALLRRIAPLERGALATLTDASKVQKLAEKLRDAADQQPAWRLSLPKDLKSLDGRWRLLYTSGFLRNDSSSSLGGLRAGPRLNSSFLEVGDIYQVYRTSKQRADTEVTLKPPAWFRGTGLPSALPFTSGNPDTVLTLSLQFDVAGPSELRFAFSDGQVDFKLFEQLKPLGFPLAPLGLGVDTKTDGLFTDTLRTTYCDGDLRIGLGGRFNELRVFQRAPADSS